MSNDSKNALIMAAISVGAVFGIIALLGLASRFALWMMP